MGALSYAFYQNTTVQKTKLEEALAREKTRGQEKSTELQRLESEARKYKEELENISKVRSDLEAKVDEETARREYPYELYITYTV